MCSSVWGNKHEMLSRVKSHQIFLSFNRLVATIFLPNAMIETNAVSTPVAKQSRISRAVLGVMYIPVAVHLKPVYELLLRQAHHSPTRRKDSNTLLELVETQLHIVINHTMIAHATFIQIRIAFIIRYVAPQRQLIWCLHRPHIQARKIRSRGKILLSPDLLSHYQQKGKYQPVFFQVFISASIHIVRKDSTSIIEIMWHALKPCMDKC